MDVKHVNVSITSKSRKWNKQSGLNSPPPIMYARMSQELIVCGECENTGNSDRTMPATASL